MITTVINEAPFQVLTSSFSISPSTTGYDLEISADGINFSKLFTVSSNTTKLVTNVASGSYYKLKGNVGEVKINWRTSCNSEGGGGDLSNYYTKSETDAAIAEATENFVTSAETEQQISDAIAASGGTSNPKVLKSIEVNDSDWSDEQVIEDYQLQVGDVVAINVIDPEGTFEHREYDDIPKTYINNSELKEISLAEFAETVQSNRNVPVLEFWFGTSKVYGEGDCYRCYWDDDENNWLIESTNGASTEGLYVEWSEGDGQYFLYKNNNINAKAPVATIVFVLENVEYETDNENQVEGWSVSSRLEDEREYFITKVNDSLYVEGLGEIIDTQILQVHQDGDWLKKYVDWDNLDSRLTNDYYTKQEVNDAVADVVDTFSGITSGLTAELSEVERVTSTAINSLRTDVNTISGATANMVTSAYGSGHNVTDIWQGTQDDYNMLTQSGATANPTTFYIIKNNPTEEL